MKAGLLLSLIPLFMWGIGDYLASKASKKLDAYTINFTFGMYSVILPFVVCAVKGFPQFDWTLFAKYIGTNFLLSLGFMCMVHGFSKGVTGIIAPLANAYALVALLVVVLVFKEPFGLAKIPPIFVLLIGIGMVSYHKVAARSSQIVHSVKFGLLAMTLSGIGFACMGKLGSQNTWYDNNLYIAAAAILNAWVLLYFKHRKKFIPEAKKGLTSKVTVFGTIFGSIGGAGLFAAFASGTSSVLVGAIAAGAPLVTALLAYYVDKEKLTRVQRLGTLLIVGGVVYINLVG